jgi:hypothetical protein
MSMVFDACSVEGKLSGVFDSAGLLDKRSTDGDNSPGQNSRSHGVSSSIGQSKSLD